MAGHGEVMTSAGEKKPTVDARIIDLILKDIDADIQASVARGDNLPQKLDIGQLANRLGFEIRRSRGAEGQSVIPVPPFYSDREMRVEVARNLSNRQLRKMAEACRSSGDDRARPSQLCNFVTGSDTDRSAVDLVAAAMLMPTQDFREWGNRLGWEIGALADSYAVPYELVSLRRDTVNSKEDSSD